MFSALFGIFKFLFFVLPVLIFVLLLGGVDINLIFDFVVQAITIFVFLVPCVMILGFLSFIGF